MSTQIFEALSREAALRQAIASAAAAGVDYPLFEDVYRNPGGHPACWKPSQQWEGGEEYRCSTGAKITLKHRRAGMRLQLGPGAAGGQVVGSAGLGGTIEPAAFEGAAAVAILDLGR